MENTEIKHHPIVGGILGVLAAFVFFIIATAILSFALGFFSTVMELEFNGARTSAGISIIVLPLVGFIVYRLWRHSHSTFTKAYLITSCLFALLCVLIVISG